MRKSISFLTGLHLNQCQFLLIHAAFSGFVLEESFLKELHFQNLVNKLAGGLNENCTLIVCYYHVTYAFQSESTLYSRLNVKELLARNRREIWVNG